MKKFVILFIATIAVTSALAQPKDKEEAEKLRKEKLTEVPDSIIGWDVNGFSSLNFSQVALNNWAAGGQGSYTFLGNTQLNANLIRKTYRWSNTLNLNYGIQKTDGTPFRKNDDRIELLSKYAKKAKGYFYYAGLMSFRTQFHATFDEAGPMISNFMSPAWAQVAFGMSYERGEDFSAMLAPIAGKFTFVSNQRLADSGSFGVDPAIIDPVTFAVLTPGKNLRAEFGAYFFMTAKKDIMKNVTVSTRLDLFNNYSDKNRDNRKNIDVNWETMISMKINTFLSASLFTHLIYDQDIPINLNRPEDPSATGPRTQFKQVLGVGIAYKY